MVDADRIEIGEGIFIPVAELSFRASRSGGPGGQHVNTSSTRIELLWNIKTSPSLPEEVRERLCRRLATRLDGEGVLRLVGSGSRSQLQNRREVLDRFGALVTAAARRPRPRRKTRPPAASREQRLKQKKRRVEIKRRRGRVRPDD